MGIEIRKVEHISESLIHEQLKTPHLSELISKPEKNYADMVNGKEMTRWEILHNGAVIGFAVGQPVHSDGWRYGPKIEHAFTHFRVEDLFLIPSKRKPPIIRDAILHLVDHAHNQGFEELMWDVRSLMKHGHMSCVGNTDKDRRKLIEFLEKVTKSIAQKKHSLKPRMSIRPLIRENTNADYFVNWKSKDPKKTAALRKQLSRRGRR